MLVCVSHVVINAMQSTAINSQHVSAINSLGVKALILEHYTQ